MSMVARRLSATIAPGGGGGSYTDLTLADSPTHYWKMDEASGSIFDEVASVEATVDSSSGSAPTYQVTGRDGFGISFPNLSHRFDTGVAATSPASGAWGVEFWFKAAGGSSPQFFVYANTFGYFGLNTSTGVALARVNSPTCTGVDDLRDGAWHHFMAGSDSTDGMALWIDGVEQADTETHQTRGGDFSIGDSAESIMDEVAFYDYRPSTAMASERYNFF